MNVQAKPISPLFSIAFIALFLASCIGDDIIDDEVDPVLRITNAIDTLEFGTSYQFELMYLNNIGREEQVDNVTWSSSDPGIISIDNMGLATGLESGQSFLRAQINIEGNTIQDEILVHVGEQTTMAVSEKSGVVATTSSYLLEGSFKLFEEGDDLVLEFADDWRASTALPGLYVYLTNNPTTTSGAHEIGAVEVFSGEHRYVLDPSIGINDFEYVLYFCKPFNVKVGDGKINE